MGRCDLLTTMAMQALTRSARDMIHETVENISTYLLSQEEVVVFEVLAIHIDVVVELLQDPTSPLTNINRLPAKEIPHILAAKYLNNVRPKVVEGDNKQGSMPSMHFMDQRLSVKKTMIFQMLLCLSVHISDLMILTWWLSVNKAV